MRRSGSALRRASETPRPGHTGRAWSTRQSYQFSVVSFQFGRRDRDSGEAQSKQRLAEERGTQDPGTRAVPGVAFA